MSTNLSLKLNIKFSKFFPSIKLCVWLEHPPSATADQTVNEHRRVNQGKQITTNSCKAVQIDSHLLWSTTIKINLSKLHCLQKRVVNAIVGVSFLHPAESRFTSLNFSGIKDIYTSLHTYYDTTLSNNHSFLSLPMITGIIHT